MLEPGARTSVGNPRDRQRPDPRRAQALFVVWNASKSSSRNPVRRRKRAYARRHLTKLFIVEKATGRLWALTIGLPLSLLYGLLWLLGPKARLPSSRTHTPMIFVMVLTICNVLVTTLLSWGDFSRYRFDVDAYFLVLFALFAQRTAARARSSIDLLRDALLRVRGRLRERSALGA